MGIVNCNYFMAESVFTSKSVSQWKFEDNFEDKQATSLLHFIKETVFFMVHTKILVLGLKCLSFQCFPSKLEKLWVYCILNSSLPALVRLLSLRIKGLRCISCSNIPKF